MKCHCVFVGLCVQHSSQSLLFVMSQLFREREKLMACLTLIFIVILTTVSKVTSLHCSDQRLPASGDDDLQQVTTLQYCLIDDCTIKRIDTGEKLDIVYTTDSVIVTTPTDGRTSEVIAKQENELPCLKPDDRLQFVLEVVLNLMIQSLSWYIIAIHIMFKELHTLFGKLLMLYNISVLFLVIGFIGRIVQLLHLVFNSLLLCYLIMVGYILAVVTLEALGTCILHHIVVTMRRIEKLRSAMSKETSQRHFRYYMMYAMGTMLLALFFIISYDVATRNYKNTLLPDGQCLSADIHIYDTLLIPVLFNGVNKVVHLVLFIAYLYYIYKMNSDISNVGVSKDHLSLLRKTATALGAVIGLTYFVYIIQNILNLNIGVVTPVIAVLFIVQQCIVAIIFAFSKKVRRLCRERYSNN